MYRTDEEYKAAIDLLAELKKQFANDFDASAIKQIADTLELRGELLREKEKFWGHIHIAGCEYLQCAALLRKLLIDAR